MLEKVKFIQEIKVDELLALTEVEGEKEYILKAPTGSGKTYMQGYLINKLLTRYPNAKIIYQSLSKGSLAKQGYDSIKRYNFSNVNPYLITTDKTSQESLVIPTNYNVYFLPRDLNKEKGLIKIPLKDFLTYKTKENVKFLIIDECHESHSNIKPYVNEFDRIYGFSATPRKEQLKPERYVELLEEDCEQIQLIKSKKVIHKDDPIFPTTNNPSEMKSYVEKKVEQAWNDFLKIKEDYKPSGINPALIIQINNSRMGSLQKETITELLNQKGILWYYRDKDGYDSNDKINELKRSNREKAWSYVRNEKSNIDVIIFKLAINVGVDIPRACYLLQIRDTQSDTLDEQVIGRIRRNPKLKDWDLLNKDLQNKLMIAYINGVEQQGTRSVKFVKKIKDIKISTTKLKNKIPNVLRNLDDLSIKKYDQTPKNIFELMENWNKLDGNIKKELNDITKDEWIELCMNVEMLNKKSFVVDYKNNLEIAGEFGLQDITFYRKDSDQIDIDKWNWEHCDSKSDKRYSFESLAEKIVAKDLSEMNLNLWGKNYFNGSKICFEYFLRQKGNYLISKQHPDFFVIKDDKKYLIEVKSYKGRRQDVVISHEDYKDKVESIKKVYSEIASITNQIMVVILEEENGDWISTVFEKHKEPVNFYNSDKYKFLEF